MTVRSSLFFIARTYLFHGYLATSSYHVCSDKALHDFDELYLSLSIQMYLLFVITEFTLYLLHDLYSNVLSMFSGKY